MESGESMRVSDCEERVRERVELRDREEEGGKIIFAPLRHRAKRHRAEREDSFACLLFSASIFRRVKMMEYMSYERKMNSIYDMVGEGKYKVRRKERI